MENVSATSTTQPAQVEYKKKTGKISKNEAKMFSTKNKKMTDWVRVLFVHHRVQGHQGCQDRVWHYLGDQEVVHYKVFFVAGSSMSKMLEADMKEAKDGS